MGHSLSSAASPNQGFYNTKVEKTTGPSAVAHLGNPVAHPFLEWTQMDGEGKAECREAIRAFDPRGGVSFAPALAS